MPSLQVRELPENIYRLLQEKAAIEHRSLAQEAIVTLAKGLETVASNKDRRNRVLTAIMAQPCNPEQELSDIDPVIMLREDRDR